MYKLAKTSSGESVIRSNADGLKTSIPFDPANTDYQAFLRWCEEGNTPEPADTPE